MGGQDESSLKATKIYRDRDRAFQVLLKQNRTIVNELRGLKNKEKNAVVALIAITKAVTRYETFGVMKDPKTLGGYYKQFGVLSPAYAAPSKFQIVLGNCFDQSVACIQAQKECRDAGGSERDCDHDPKVVGPCANEVYCFLKAMTELNRGIPEILEGNDPWPPMPFPR